MSSSAEKRAHPRHPCNMPVTIISDEFAWQGTILNYSEGGMFAASELAPSVGTKLGFRFTHPQDSTIVEVEGIVRRVAEGAGTRTGKPGFGVQFVRLLSDVYEETGRQSFVSAG